MEEEVARPTEMSWHFSLSLYDRIFGPLLVPHRVWKEGTSSTIAVMKNV